MKNKIKKYLKYLVNYKLRKLRYSELYLNLTSRCNSNCIYCEARFLDHSRDMSTERITNLLLEAKLLGIKKVYFSGGEPLLHQSIFELIRYAHELELNIGMVSNGLLIEGLSDEQVSQLKLLDEINISLESAESIIHNQLRGGFFFDRTVSGIKKLVASRINVNLSTVISAENFRQLPELIVFAKSLGVSYINFQPFHAYSNYNGALVIDDKKNLLISKKELPELGNKIKEAISLAKKIGQRTNLSAVHPWLNKYFIFQSDGSSDWPQNIAHNFHCLEVSTKLFIDSDGGLLPCAMLSSRSNVKEKSLAEAIKALAGIKKEIENGKFPAECKKCSCQVAPNYISSILISPIKNIRQIINLIKNI